MRSRVLAASLAALVSLSIRGSWAAAPATAGESPCASESPTADTAPAAEPPPSAEAAPAAPSYRIYPLRNGTCRVLGRYAFADNEADARSYEFTLYVWLILGGPKPILVDAGLEDVAHMNEGAAHVFAEPIHQAKEETTAAQLRKFGLSHEDIGHVLVTHLHFDHVDELFKYRGATYCIGKREWELCAADDGARSWCDGRILFPLLRDASLKGRLRLLEDGEVVPGIEAFWVGGHTPGSMAYRVRTTHGWAVLAGDTISLRENLERPPGVFAEKAQVRPAIQRILERADGKDLILPSHDPRTPERWPPLPPGSPRYTIRPVRVGECRVTEEIAFQDRWGEGEKTRPFVLYVWVIEGGERPILVETGPNPRHVEAFNRATAKYIPGGVKQRGEEDTLVALKRAGVDPASVSHVIVTHLHADHYDYFADFPNARLVVNRAEWEDGRDGLAEEVAAAIAARPGAILVVGDEEVAPGIRAVPLGCHTRGSQGVLVRTWLGPVLLCGDVVYLYDNIEEDRPTRSPDPKACTEAMARIRSLADIVLPAHDPDVLVRWPKGLVGGKD